MIYNRPQSKWLAREAMRGVAPHPLLVSLVYVLLTGVLGSMVINFAAEPFQAAYYYLTETNYDVWEILTAIFTPQRVAVILAMELLLTLYQWVMGYGFTSYCLRLTRRERPGYQNLLDGFYNVGRVLGAKLLSALLVLLWGLLGAAVCGGLAVLGWALRNGALTLTGIMIMTFWMVAVSYRYRLAAYFLLDHPEMGPAEAVRHSRNAMRGRAGELFVQDLSFLGWLLLTPITLGLVGVWLCPYMGAAEANFYAWAVYGSMPGQTQPGPGEDWSRTF